MEITEALAIELTKNLLINGQGEKPLTFGEIIGGNVMVILSDGSSKIFNRVEVEHARIMLKSRGE